MAFHERANTYYWFSGAQEIKQYLDEWNEFHNKSILNESKPHQKTIFLNGTGGDLIFTGYYHRKVNRLPTAESWWVLSFLEKKNRCLRTAENKLELQIIEGSWKLLSQEAGEQ